jgi:hypothetical protein
MGKIIWIPMEYIVDTPVLVLIYLYMGKLFDSEIYLN